MKEKLIDRFLDYQLKPAFLLGGISLVMIFSFDSGALRALLVFLFSLLFIFAGDKLFVADTAENWLKFSSAAILKNVFGAAFMLIGWTILLRSVCASAIALIFLKTA